jgi:hypothetical protein
MRYRQLLPAATAALLTAVAAPKAQPRYFDGWFEVLSVPSMLKQQQEKVKEFLM